MTVGQKLDELEKEIQDFEIIQDDCRNIIILPEKLLKLEQLINIKRVRNEEFNLYIKALPLKYVKDSIKKCKINYRRDEDRKRNLIKIKKRIKAAIHWFKEGCYWYGVEIVLNKKIIELSYRN